MEEVTIELQNPYGDVFVTRGRVSNLEYALNLNLLHVYQSILEDIGATNIIHMGSLDHRSMTISFDFNGKRRHYKMKIPKVVDLTCTHDPSDL